MIGRAIGAAVAALRDLIARGLVRAGVTPNALTVTGMVLTAAAGACYALGAGSERFAWSFGPATGEPSGWLALAGTLLLLSSACDMLDGAVARLGRKATAFGAFLDSTLDRVSDFAVYLGIAAYYARQQPANVTFVLLSMVAFFNAVMISYTRARAEDIIASC
ncbi:MAG: CDP-alcohol phosphatidyltransferase family protein, partial [Planctomycetes bacterium]|nr:CDP-alcohol phosphatidyltransferase family protein [Planctomycetota bacterium]